MGKLHTATGTFVAAILLSLLLAACPSPATYQSTITPIYAATSANGLFVSSDSGSTWKNYTTANGLASNNLTSVVVSGSGSGADVFVGTSASGISGSSGSSWQTWKNPGDGLGSNTISSLFLGSGLYASTSGGVSTLKYSTDGATPAWTNVTLPSGTPNAIAAFGNYTYVASSTGLYVFNGTAQEPLYLSGTNVTAVLADSNQDIIVGTNTGILVLFGGAASFGTTPVSSVVHRLFMDNWGTLYAATASGLYFVNILNNASAVTLIGTPILCVYVDGAGTIYAGTASGLEISKDGGSTWTATPSLVGKQVNDVVTTAPLYSF